MVTWVLIAVLFCVLFALLWKSCLLGIVGFVIGLLVGLIVALNIGYNFPSKTSTLISQPVDQLAVGSDVGVFYLERDESNKKYIYSTDGEIKILGIYEINVEFENIDKPFIEIQRTELDLPKGQGWKLYFGISNLPTTKTTIYIPQGSIYILE